MTTWMWFFLFVIILKQGTEFTIARRNEQWLKRLGAIEYGQRYHKWFGAIYSLFILAIVMEITQNNAFHGELNILLIAFYLGISLLRIWCIHKLGRFWTTKSMILPGVYHLRQGPYKYLKYPDQYITTLNIFVIPLIFGAYMTAFTFPFLLMALQKLLNNSHQNIWTNTTST